MCLLRLYAILVAVLSAAAPARAAFTTYTSQASFLATAGSVSTENFDEFRSPTNLPNAVMIDRVTYISQAGWGVFTFPSVYPPSSPPNIIVQSNILNLTALAFDGGSVQSLGDGSVQSLGFTFVVPVVQGVPVAYPAVYTLSVYETNGSITAIPVSASAGGDLYFGFIESTPGVGITELVVTPLTNTLGVYFNHGYDDVSRGTITPGDYPVLGVPFAPEPPSLVMGTTAVVIGLGLALASRKRRTSHA
jgi:hypothetical protein